MDKHQQITAEILRSKFESTIAEMRATLINTACSSTISESKECCSALFTETGLLVAIDNPLHMPSMVDTAACVLDYFQYDLGTEDVILTNDPYGGGTRVQDFTLIAPLSFEDEIVGYLGVRAHMEDFAGDLRGNYNPRATDIWAEGARCPPLKIYRDGKLLKDTLNTVTLNSRSPEAFRLDLDAMLAARNIGERRITELFRDYGLATVVGAMDWVIDYGERRFRALIANWPEGTFEGRTELPHDCHERTDLVIRTTLRIAQQKIELDFSGSDAQSSSFINAPRGVTLGHALLPIFAALDGEVPKNAGSLRCVEMLSKPGTLVDVSYPAPTAWSSQHVGCEVSSAVLDALSQVLPERCSNVAANLVLAFTVQRGIRNGYTVEQLGVRDYARFGQGGCSGASGRDGWGMPGVAATAPLPSAEMYEAGSNGLVEQMEFIEDSAGAGQWRGGNGTEVRIKLPEPDDGDLYLTACVVDQRDSESGLVGGNPGIRNRLEIHTQSEHKTIDRTYVDTLVGPGTRISIITGGGAGWGSPFDRSPESVLTDVANGFVSIEAAQRDYGVVIQPEQLVVDAQKTENVRSERNR
jgi:N-methylhydantoinase B